MNTPGLNTTTPIDSETFASQVESDKRSILQQVLRYSFMDDDQHVEKSQSIKVKKTYNPADSDRTEDANSKDKLARGKGCQQPTTETSGENKKRPVIDINICKEYAEIFGEDDVDDSEEIFNRILAEVEEQVKQKMEIKRKNPYNTLLLDEMTTFKKPRAKRGRKAKNQYTTKAFAKSIEIMNKFRKSLANDTNEIGQPTLAIGSRTDTVYPKWKTTATHTPIFAASENPRWKNLNKITSVESMDTTTTTAVTPIKSSPRKMYTPGHVADWVKDVTSVNANRYFPAVTPPSKSIKSANATCNTELKTISCTAVGGNDHFDNCDDDDLFLSTPTGSPIGQSTPKKTPIHEANAHPSGRKSVVRFKDSSPERISYSDISDFSSPSFLGNDGNAGFYQPSPLPNHHLQPQFREHMDVSTPIYLQNHCGLVSPMDPHRNQHRQTAAGNGCYVESPLIHNFEAPGEKEARLSVHSDDYRQHSFASSILDDDDDSDIEMMIPEMHNVYNENDLRNEIFAKESDKGSGDVGRASSSRSATQHHQQPFFFDDFVRKLNNNVLHNYSRNVSVKYSMKVKYF